LRGEGPVYLPEPLLWCKNKNKNKLYINARGPNERVNASKGRTEAEMSKDDEPSPESSEQSRMGNQHNIGDQSVVRNQTPTQRHDSFHSLLQGTAT
jgi:hypothetical protein